MQPTRREVLRTAAAATLAACLPSGEAKVTRPDVPGETDAPGETGGPPDVPDLPDPPEDTLPPWDPDAIPEDEALFPFAVTAGSMRPERAIVLTRTRGAPPELQLRVWRSDDGVRVWDAPAVVFEGGVVRVNVTGLSPDTAWRYALFLPDDSARSAIGAFRTPPADDAEGRPLTLALAACMGDATGRRDALGRIADQPVDAILCLGDTAYNDGAETIGEYRRSWEGWMTSPGYRAAFASAGCYATWDDHEVDNGWNPEAVDRGTFESAYQSFWEHMPFEPGPQGELWGSFRWGRTAELLVLDCRGERRPSTRGAADLYVSRAQMDWLLGRLRTSPARFKIVLNSVPITNMPRVWDLAASDRWEGYPRQRDELLNTIRDEDLADVWFVSGDFHVCFVSQVQADGGGRLGDTWEIAVTSGNTNTLGALLNQPQFRFNSSQPHTTLLRFDPGTGEVTITFLSPDDGSVVWERSLRQA